MKNIFSQSNTEELSKEEIVTIDGGTEDATLEYYYNKGRCFAQNIKGFFSELFS